MSCFDLTYYRAQMYCPTKYYPLFFVQYRVFEFKNLLIISVLVSRFAAEHSNSSGIQEDTMIFVYLQRISFNPYSFVALS
jgi:hypothetical protein